MAKPFWMMTDSRQRMSLRFPDRESLPFPNQDLDFELSRTNYTIAMMVILNGLIRGSVIRRKNILRTLRGLSTWINFPEYLASGLQKDLKRDIGIEVTDEYIFRKVADYGPDLYDALLSRRSAKGILANMAQALYMRPKTRHITKAIQIVNKVVEREATAGNDHASVMRRMLESRPGKP